MRLSVLVASKLVLLATLSSVTSAGAEEDRATPPAPIERPWHVGMSAGLAYATVRHTTVIPSSFTAPQIGIHAGYNVSERLMVGFELSSYEKYMSRDNGRAPFTPVGYTPQRRCDDCEIPAGGWVAKVTASFATVGPRIEFAPFGKDGLYVGAGAGLAALWGADSAYGFGGSARIGYRVRIGGVLGLALEGGTNAQTYGGGDYTVAPYGMAMLRPYF